jgi:hypothetical protein
MKNVARFFCLLTIAALFTTVQASAQSTDAATKPVVASVAQDTAAPTEAQPIVGLHQRRPRVLKNFERGYDAEHSIETAYNDIWAGYAATGSNFTFVQGSWIVGTAHCTVTPNSDSSEWVGIDGFSNDTVEQVGTDSYCAGTTPTYYAWYEFYPNGTIPISTITVSAGDKMAASVTYNGSSYFTVAITDETTGVSYSKKVKFTGADGSGTPERSTVEWIMEMDGTELTDFGVDSFGNYFTNYAADTATSSSISGPISSFSSTLTELITTQDGSSTGTVTAQPSSLASDGGSFTVTWKSE